MKKHALLVFSIAFITVGALGLIGVEFFQSNTVLEIAEIIFGGLGLLIEFGKIK